MSSVVFSQGSIDVVVNPQPIGGFRGKTGAVSYIHKQSKHFAEWNSEDLTHLADLIQRTMKIMQLNNVQNMLLHGDFTKTTGTLTLVPYPKCNWYEKLQGYLHTIWGGSRLSGTQQGSVFAFYHTQFLETVQNIHYAQFAPEQPVPRAKLDPFCRPEVINKQLIKSTQRGGQNYHLLQDNCPKGQHAEDDHLLVIPEGEVAHQDRAYAPLKTRTDMLTIAQSVIQYMLLNHERVILVERNGKQLHGVSHLTDNIFTVRVKVTSFFSKLYVLLRQLMPFKSNLSPAEMKARIQRFSEITLPASI